MERKEILKQIFQFLNEIDIKYRLDYIESETFLPGLKINNGQLVIDDSKLENPGDILHEAGHIAVSLPEERNTLCDNVITDNEAKAGEEMAVLLWSYAAAKHISLPLEIVFHKNGYKGDSEWISQQFETKNYIGLPLLQWMGLTYSNGNERIFPEMKLWLREK